MKNLALILILGGVGVAVYFVLKKGQPAALKPAAPVTAATAPTGNANLASYITAGAAALSSLKGLFTGNSTPASLNPNFVTGQTSPASDQYAGMTSPASDQYAGMTSPASDQFATGG